jgi:hypothetical protein
MKEIMAKASSESPQGVPTFEYNPAVTTRQPLLFELTRPLDELPDLLFESFRGQTLTFDQIYARHNIDRPYIEANYKEVLKLMEQQKRISCDPPAEKRRPYKGTPSFGPKTQVTFKI